MITMATTGNTWLLWQHELSLTILIDVQVSTETVLLLFNCTQSKHESLERCVDVLNLIPLEAADFRTSVFSNYCPIVYYIY
jgi:hypothetical protein